MHKEITYYDEVKSFDANWLFHLGAYTDLEYYELHEDDNYATNTESVKHTVKISNDLPIPKRNIRGSWTV